MLYRSRTRRFTKAVALAATLGAGGLFAQDVGDAYRCSMDCHNATMIAAIILGEPVSSDDMWATLVTR